MELIMRATDQKTNEAQLLTIPYLDSECGAEDRDAPRKYSLQIDSGVPEYLEARYQRDLRGFVGGGHGQKKVLAVYFPFPSKVDESERGCAWPMLMIM
jgi:hypothetical protein